METEDRLEDSKLHFMHLWSVFIIAIAYPLMHELSRSPEFFVARRNLPVDVVSMVLILCLLLPGLLIILEWLIWRINQTYARIFHGVVLAVLLMAWMLVNLRYLDSLPGILALLSAGVLSIIVAFGYFQLKWIRYFFNYFSVVVILVPLLFLINPSIRKVLSGASSFIPMNSVSSNVPVVMVIFDEMPLISLLNEQGEIDKNLFPNFSALAETSYWFRNATTLYDYTIPSVSAILTGKKATNRLPNFMEYPNNLFTLLARSYDLQVFESATQLCPGRQSYDPYWLRITLLVEDLSAVYLNLAAPKDFSYNLPDITRNWKNFWGSNRRNSASDDRRQLFNSFLQSIHPSLRPSLYFIHVALPHTPWEHLPDGKRYNPDLIPYNPAAWPAHPWLATQALQRHLSSVCFMDHLIGSLITRLKQAGLFDRALMIVTSDHGISFHSGHRARFVDGNNYCEIAYIPLFIKLPNQKDSIQSERNIQSIDILPTIADVLKISLPWQVEGSSALDTVSTERATKTIYHSREIILFDKPMLRDILLRLPLHNQDSIIDSISKNREMLGSPDLFRIGPNREWIGQPISKLNITGKKDFQLQIYNQKEFENVDLRSDFLPAMIAGQLQNSTPIALGIVLNDILAATTWTFPEHGSQMFSAMIPDSAFRTGRNTVSILWFPRINNPETLMLN